MSVRLRKLLASKIFQTFDNGQLNPTEVQDKITTWFTLRSLTPEHTTLQLSANHLKKLLGQDSDLETKLASIASEVPGIASFSSHKTTAIFNLTPDDFVKDVLADTREYRLVDEPTENIIVEYSSPNIAKPFHIGHLRSTIIGNFLSNLFSAFGHNVTRINYLGDWGTQFGYLKLGMDMSNVSEDEFIKNPIKHLFHAYVAANRAAETDPTVAQKARDIFHQMENSSSNLDAWNQYRKYTVDEMETLYARLGVKFDVYAWESDYRKANILEILNSIEKLGFLQTDSDGKKSFVLSEEVKAPILKSDGSTLYLTRDIAAIFDRQEKYKFDRMFYVAGNEQHLHFQTLFAIAKELGVRNADRLHHIRFGRVEKMSTRKGNVVFLSDILDEIRELMYERQLKYSRVDLDTDDKKTADIMSVSALIAFELERKPTSSYEFDMQSILENTNSSGKSFQMTYARLCSIESTTGIVPAIEADAKYLCEPEALQLIYDIARFPDVLYEAKKMLSANRLLTYMYSLNSRTKTALKALRVMNEPNPDCQAQRMLLFMTAKQILSTCMKLISITPLEKT